MKVCANANSKNAEHPENQEVLNNGKLQDPCSFTCHKQTGLSKHLVMQHPDRVTVGK